ncbi:MAG: hypothetical protein DRN35_02015 [Thermoplasmata archaeon]|nr:MAG: hypothetical protein DRN28_04380 [Thermoplasmata archaeon]RLF71670.1 MAG: hypothetical protein DRN35_02015 [Thermoplasmata archaeon]
MVMPAEDEDRPRVLLGAPTYKPRAGGSTTYFSTLVDKLKGKVEFLVYSTVHPEAPREEEKDGVKIYRIQPFLIDSPKLIRYLILPPVTWIQLKRLWKKHGPFIIHAHSAGLYGYIISLFTSAYKIPMVKDIQDLSDPPWSAKAGNVRMYIGTGNAVEQKLLELGIERERMIIHPALNPPQLEDIAKTIKQKVISDHIRVLFVAALRPYKAPDVVLKAFKIIEEQRDDIILDIIGEGSEEKWCKRFIKKNGLKNVKMHGTFKEYRKVLEYIANADIIILPSRLGGESWGRVICEGFAFEKPAIATNIPAIKNVIRDGYNGILIDVDDPQALAREIIRLADNPQLRRELGRNGKKWLATLPTWDDIAEDIYRVYLDLWTEVKKNWRK